MNTRGIVINPRLWWVLGALLGLLHAAPGMAQECPLGTAFCYGIYGSGCYNSISAACHDGLVCSGGSSPCVGRYGAGCYNPAYATCHNGLACATSLQPCLTPHSASCYDPSRATCAASPANPLRPRSRR